MEPEIRYTTTSDGVSIAYYTMGEGYPLVVTSWVLWSHLRRQPFPEYHRSRSGRGLGRGLQIVRYDARGTGLSDRHPIDFSMDARMLDLEAVVQQLKLMRFAIFGSGHGTPAAVTYAAGNPERVSHLILESAYARGRDHRETAKGWDSLRDTADEQWERYALTAANVQLGFSDSESAQKLASRLRESMTPESVRAFYAAQQAIDVTALLSRIAVPTVVVYRPFSGNSIQLEWSRVVASKIPGARFVTVTPPDERVWPDEETRIVEDFLGVNQDVPAAASVLPSGTAIILFADIVDSTALTERLGDAAFRAKARELGGSLRTLIRECAGTPVEGPTLGDGVLAVFTSAREAIAAAVRCAAVGESAGLSLHLGLHAGDVTREKDPDGRDNVYGGAVNIAARISGLSAAGEVLVSETVRSLARTSAGVAFEDRGEQSLKGIADSQRIFAVRGREGDT